MNDRARELKNRLAELTRERREAEEALQAAAERKRAAQAQSDAAEVKRAALDFDWYRREHARIEVAIAETLALIQAL